MKPGKLGNFVPARRWVHVSGGETIRILRKKLGWTQAQLARRCGLSLKKLSSMENNRADIDKNLAGQPARALKNSKAILTELQAYRVRQSFEAGRE